MTTIFRQSIWILPLLLFSTIPSSPPSFANNLQSYIKFDLQEIATWQTLLPDGKTFKSPGHSNEPVRIYFNKTAAPYFSGTKSLPFAVGSNIAKAFVADETIDGFAADRIFFMKKRQPGYDSNHGDWEYAVYEKRKGKKGSTKIEDFRLTLDGPLPTCVECHKKYKKQDYVLSLERFQPSSIK